MVITHPSSKLVGLQGLKLLNLEDNYLTEWTTVLDSLASLPRWAGWLSCILLIHNSWHIVVMHLSILCLTAPSRVISGKRWGFELCKILMHHLLGMPVSQIPTLSSPHLKHGDLSGDLLVNVHTSVYAYGERSNCPSIEQVLMSNWSQMPHLSPI